MTTRDRKYTNADIWFVLLKHTALGKRLQESDNHQNKVEDAEIHLANNRSGKSKVVSFDFYTFCITWFL